MKVAYFKPLFYFTALPCRSVFLHFELYLSLYSNKIQLYRLKASPWFLMRQTNVQSLGYAGSLSQNPKSIATQDVMEESCTLSERVVRKRTARSR